MSLEGIVLSLILGYFSGLLFFYHLLLDVRRVLTERKGGLRFWRRFFLFGAFAGACAYYLESNFISFPLGFYLSRLTFSVLLLRMGDRWILRRGS